MFVRNIFILYPNKNPDLKLNFGGDTAGNMTYFSSFVIYYAHFQISVSYNITFMMFPHTNTDPHEAHNLSSCTLSIPLFQTVLSSFEQPKHIDNIFFPLYITNTLKIIQIVTSHLNMNRNFHRALSSI